MWAEVIFSRDDLAGVLEQAFPLTLQLGDVEKKHTLALRELSRVTLVPDLGLRVVCKAQIRWPVLGVDLPVDVSSLSIVLAPAVESRGDGDVLVFRASVDHADFSALPALIGDRIVAALNARLAAKGAELTWNFTKALTHLVSMPAMLDPLESLALRPAWGKVRITSEAVVYAASFHSTLARRGTPSD